MNSTYRQSVQPPREARDWSWERGPHLWTRRSPLQLPPISWGSPQLKEGLVQDRLHAQNHTWVNGVNDSDSSFYSISDLDTIIEIDPSDGLLDRLGDPRGHPQSSWVHCPDSGVLSCSLDWPGGQTGGLLLSSLSTGPCMTGQGTPQLGECLCQVLQACKSSPGLSQL